MALIFSPPSSSSCSIPPSSSIFFRKRASRAPSYFPSSKPSRTFPSHLSSEQIPPACCLCTRKAPIFTSSPSPPSPTRRKAPIFSSPVATSATGGGRFYTTIGDLELDAEGKGGREDGEGSPWEGAVVYRRDASVTHLEYCTTLERLGLGRLSTEVSRSRASAMGIRVVHAGKGAAAGDPSSSGTPVLVSIDVTRKKRKLVLDGILRTVITLSCNRCAQPAAKCVFSNFALLLTEDPVEDPEDFDMGIIYGEDKSSRAASMGEDEDEQLIDLDDRFYFPAGEKQIDISKPLRDMVHLEITISAVCDASCKGVCLGCGTNLNRSSCSCKKGAAQQQRKEYGPLGALKRQMQQR